MNDENLIPFNKRTPRERRELSKKGAAASTKAKRQRKTMREMMNMLLSLPVSNNNKAMMETLGITNDDDKNNTMLVAVGLMKRAATGDPRAVEVLCGIAGDIFTIPKDKEDDQSVEKAIDSLKDFKIEIVDASLKGEKDENN